MNDILNAIPIGFALAFMIGPVFFVLLETSVLKGFRAATIFDLGVILADIVFVYFAYYGSKSMLVKIKDDPRLFVIGGLILFIYGLITILKRKKPVDTEGELVKVQKNNYLGLFIKGFFLNFINVGVLAFWIGMIVIAGPNLGMDETRIFNYFATIIIAYFVTDLLKIVLAKQLKNKLTPVVIYKIKLGMGIALMVFGLVLGSKGFISEDALQKIDTVLEKKIKP
ncbi:MAG TPA: lysine transporter LysE [Flavobacteriaceae bacterium]|jgi:threonine/homoserine/homoserine lactone efflux protein|nr:lysine transporter LysE [Flavobacteriaceae bacterium]HBS11560.1 lysine transporter LysE [Flavobacteriaceae bacterium]